MFVWGKRLFQNLVLKIWGRSSKEGDRSLTCVTADVPLFRENGKIIPIYLLFRCCVVKWSNSNIIIYVGEEVEFISVFLLLLSFKIFACHIGEFMKKVFENFKVAILISTLSSTSLPCFELLYLLGATNYFNDSDNFGFNRNTRGKCIMVFFFALTLNCGLNCLFCPKV